MEIAEKDCCCKQALIDVYLRKRFLLRFLVQFGGFGGRCGEVRTSPEIFSTSPNNIIDEINFKRQLYKLHKKGIKCRHNYIKVIKVRYFFISTLCRLGEIIVAVPLKIFPPPPPYIFSKIRPWQIHSFDGCE